MNSGTRQVCEKRADIHFQVRQMRALHGAAFCEDLAGLIMARCRITMHRNAALCGIYDPKLIGAGLGVEFGRLASCERGTKKAAWLVPGRLLGTV